ncbi:MAG: hypothetical protein KIH64_006280 [Mycobacterium sp.]|nr:hypothetical protein [Mycobacterium sp.]
MSWATKRRDPYTRVGIARLRCIRCGGAPSEQWSACADNNNWRPLCITCDVELNRIVLEWMGHPDVAGAIDRYVARKLT